MLLEKRNDILSERPCVRCAQETRRGGGGRRQRDAASGRENAAMCAEGVLGEAGGESALVSVSVF